MLSVCEITVLFKHKLIHRMIRMTIPGANQWSTLLSIVPRAGAHCQSI